MANKERIPETDLHNLFGVQTSDDLVGLIEQQAAEVQREVDVPQPTYVPKKDTYNTNNPGYKGR